MSDLRDTLAAISAALHSLPARVSAPHEIGESLEHATQGFLRQVQQLESSAADRVERARHAISGLGHEATEVQTQVESETEAVEALVHEHSRTFSDRRHELSAQFEATRQAMDALQQHLAQDGAAAQAAQDEVGRALTDLEHTAQAAQQELQAAVGEAAREAEALQVAAEAAAAELQPALKALGDVMTSLATDAQEKLEQTLEETEKAIADHAQALESDASRLQEGEAKLAEMLHAAIERELKGRLEEAAAAAAQELNALALAAHDEAQRAARSRGDLDTALKSMEDEKPSIEDVIGHVKNAVEIVGLVWGV